MTAADPRRREVREIASGGEMIHAEVTGSGPPLVLCHGLGGNHAIWWRQVDTLARHHRVVTWDQRGFGNSTSSTGDLSIEAAARDLLVVLDDLEMEDACVVGQSMGAFAALRAALIDPRRFGRLVISTSLVATPREHTDKLQAVAATRGGRDQHPVISEAFSEAEPDLVVLYNLISSFGAKPTSAAMLQNMASTEFCDEELKALAVPVALVAAENDPLCPPEVMELAQQRMRDATLHVLPGDGHSAYYENPSAWNDLILEIASGRLG